MNDEDKAYETFQKEYLRCWRPGGDSDDHDDAVRSAVSAVVEHTRAPLVENFERQRALTLAWSAEAERLRPTDDAPTDHADAHTCHAACGCHTGGKPAPDFEELCGRGICAKHNGHHGECDG